MATTLSDLERRLTALEHSVEQLSRRPSAPASQKWWLDTAGGFVNDPVFDEIVRLGRQYRQSLRPPETPRAKRRTKSKTA
jgi:hypothetical protein